MGPGYYQARDPLGINCKGPAWERSNNRRFSINDKKKPTGPRVGPGRVFFKIPYHFNIKDLIMQISSLLFITNKRQLHLLLQLFHVKLLQKDLPRFEASVYNQQQKLGSLLLMNFLQLNSLIFLTS